MTFLIVQNDAVDAIDGGFGFIFNPPGYAANVNYAFSGTDSIGRTDTGNDIAVTITAVAVPEPNGLALASSALCAATWFSRRRKWN